MVLSNAVSLNHNLSGEDSMQSQNKRSRGRTSALNNKVSIEALKGVDGSITSGKGVRAAGVGRRSRSSIVDARLDSASNRGSGSGRRDLSGPLKISQIKPPQ